MGDFPIRKEETTLQNILPPLHQSVVAVHINWIGLPCDKVSKLHDLNVRAKAENACVGEREMITVLDDVLSCSDVSELVNIPELAVNKFVVNELQNNQLFPNQY